MSLPALFISHSSQQEPIEADLLQKLRTALVGKMELLLDQDLLQGGDDWRQEIHTWMAVCQAAVVLFSPGVLARPKWVRKETLILEWRQTLDARFLLIPVLLPGFTWSDLGKIELDPAHLERLQALTPSAVSGDTADALCDRILAALKPVIEGAVAANVLAPLVNSLAAELVPLTSTQCDNACATLAKGPKAWMPAATPQEQLAYALVHAPLTDTAGLLASLHATLKERTPTVVRILAAFWVRAEAASRLSVAARRPPGRRAAVLNTDREDIGEYYIWRAMCAFLPGRKWCNVQIQDPEHPAESVHAQVVKHFGVQCPLLPPKNLPQEVERRCGSKAREPFFLLLPEGSKAVPKPTVEAVRSHAPISGCTLLLLSPPTFQHRLDFADADTEFVEPPLDELAEAELNQFLTDALV